MNFEWTRRSAAVLRCALIALGGAAADAADNAAPARMHRVRVPAEFVPAVRHTTAVDYGSFAWLTLTEAEHEALAMGEVPYQDDLEGFALRLGEMSFDPLDHVPAQPVGLAAVRAEGADLHLVQFDGPAKREWLAGVRASGLQIVQYIPPHTYVVWGTPVQRAAAAAHPRVRWAGNFEPAYRVLPQYRVGHAGRDSARALVYRGADLDAVRQALAALGAKVADVQDIDDRFAIVAFELDASRLADVASVPGVYSAKFVPQDGGLRGEMSNQVNVNNVNASNIAFPGYQTWLAGVGLSGAGVIIANVDGGIAHTHVDLVNRMAPCAGSTCGGAASSSHGTHTAGIMAADGSSGVTLNGFLRGLGMAPGANLVEQVYSPTFSQPGGMLTLMRQSYQNGASLSGNSWGPAGTPRGYDDDTMQVDIGVRDADSTTPGHQPLSFVLSIMNGNGGTSSQGSPDEAKNIFTIGSTKMQTSSGSQQTAINDVSANSAHGPALDGRKIPHMVAPGCSVDSTVPTNTYAVSGYCGTSMASPHVSGAVALFIEHYRSLPDTLGDPSPALIKAAFLAVARDLAGNRDADNGILGHPFDSKQGWGRMDAEAVLDPQVAVRYFDNPAVFENTGEEWTVAVTADDPLQPVRLMLVWTDAPGHGLGGSTPAWNNDLDLIVEVGANTYRGNVFGANGYSTIGGIADNKNNTEGVFLEGPGAGAINVRVQAASINSDALPGVGDTTDQDFSVVCYNCALPAGYALMADPASLDVCAGSDADYAIDVLSFSGYAEPVTLNVLNPPAGAAVEFSVNPVTPPDVTTLTIGNTGAVAAGTHAMTVEGVSSVGLRSASVSLNLFDAVPPAVTLLSPPNGAIEQSLAPVLTWSAAAGAQSYTVEVATDVAFANIVFSESISDTSTTVLGPLDTLTTYYWRVRADNVCGTGAGSAVFMFDTRETPRVLLVDDDDNDPDVRSYYTNALAAIGVDYDIWDTNEGASEPDAATLNQYVMVIWFSGHLFGGNESGPSPSGEASLATFLDNGGCFFITSQDYHYDRGLTSFMTSYLGVASVTNDQGQTSATGAGPLFSGYGPYTLSYPFSNFSDIVNPNGSAEVAFVGNVGNLAVNHDNGVYRASYWGFPFEAIPSAGARADLMGTLVGWCGAFPPEPPIPGDYDGDGDVDLDDVAHWADCMTGPVGGPVVEPCAAFDFDADTHVDVKDFHAFQAMFGE